MFKSNHRLYNWYCWCKIVKQSVDSNDWQW